jgi:hypothetical protein
MTDLHSSAARSAAPGAPVPAAVRETARQRRLGVLLDERHGRPAARTAAVGFGTAAGALVVAVPLDVELQSMDSLSPSFSVLHALFTACAFTVIAGLALGIRALVAGSPSYYRYADGIVRLRRSGPQVITWAEADRLEPVYQRRTQSDAGRILGYRLRARGGASILIPPARVEGRDSFMDGVLAAAQAGGLQIG